MSTIVVDELQGRPTESNTVTVPSGHTLDMASGSTLDVTGATVSGLNNFNVIEQIEGMCDASSRTTKKGTVTFQNVTALQTVNSTSYTDLSGSAINYCPPDNCIGVKYEFTFGIGWGTNDHSIQHYRVYFNGNEVTRARWTMGGRYVEDIVTMGYYFRIIPGSTNYAEGYINETLWNTNRQIKIMTRAYNSSSHTIQYQHGTHYFDGTGSHQFHKPSMKITAYGAVT